MKIPPILGVQNWGYISFTGGALFAQQKSSFLQTAQSRRRGFTPILRPHGFGPGGCGGRIRPFPVNRKREKEP